VRSNFYFKSVRRAEKAAKDRKINPDTRASFGQEFFEAFFDAPAIIWKPTASLSTNPNLIWEKNALQLVLQSQQGGRALLYFARCVAASSLHTAGLAGKSAVFRGRPHFRQLRAEGRADLSGAARF
jgi:hypothetical protein